MLKLGMLVFLLALDLPEGWVAIKAANLGYHVSMPKPERKAFLEVGPDEKPGHISHYQGTSGKMTFTVTVTEYSKVYLSQPVNKIFDQAREKTLARLKGTMKSEKDIKFDSITGREIVIKTSNAEYLKMRLFVFNLRQYAVMITGVSESDLESEHAKLFMNSFQLKPLKRTIK